MFRRKIINYEELNEVIKHFKTQTPWFKIVTTNGAFDLMHSGHLHGLKEARKQGDLLIVGLNSDASIKRYKSKDRPIIPQDERAKMLEAIEWVDYVIIFEEDDPRELLKIIKPNVHVKSQSGFKGIEREVVEKNGGRIYLFDDIPSLSTTTIIEKIKRLE